MVVAGSQEDFGRFIREFGSQDIGTGVQTFAEAIDISATDVPTPSGSSRRRRRGIPVTPAEPIPVEPSPVPSPQPIPPAPQPARIERFDPLRTQFPLPTRQELGVDTGFIGGIRAIGREALSRARVFINVGTQRDLDIISRREGAIQTGLEEKIMVREIPTGTRIDPGLGIRKEITFKERVEKEAIIGGGAGTPAEFIAQDISREVTAKVQSEFDKESIILQEKINRGDLTLAQAEAQLKTKEKEFEKKAQSDFEKRLKTDTRLSAKLRSDASIRELRKLQKFDIVSAGVSAGIVAGSLIPGTQLITGAVVFGFGARRTTLGAGRIIGAETGRERLFGAGQVALGTAELAIGGTILSRGFRGVERQIDILGLKELEQAPARILGVERIKTPRGSLFEVRTLKQTPQGRIITVARTPVFPSERPPIVGRTELGVEVLLKKGERFTSITGGKAVSKIEFFSLEQGKLIKSVERFGFFGRAFEGQASPILKSPLKGVQQKLTEFKGTFGTGGIIRDGKIIQTRFGAIAREKEGVIQLVAGDISRVRIGLAPKGRVTGFLDITGTGFIKRSQLGRDVGVKIFSGRGIKTPLSKTFGLQQQVQELGGVSALTERGVRQSISSFQKQLVSGRKLVSDVGFVGQRQFQKQQIKPQVPIQKQELIQRLKQPTLGAVLVKQPQRQKFRVSAFQPQQFRQLPKQEQDTLISQKFGQGLSQALRQIQKQRLKSQLRMGLRQQLIPTTFQPPTRFGLDFAPRGIRFPFIPPFISFFGGGARRRRVPFKKPIQPTKITPSLTAAALGLRGAPPKLILGRKEFGVTPGIRLLPTKRKRRK